MDERLWFVSRLLDGEAMTDACREFGIPRKTSYVWSEWRDSNPRPLVPQTSALTGLRHAPMPFP